MNWGRFSSLLSVCPSCSCSAVADILGICRHQGLGLSLSWHRTSGPTSCICDTRPSDVPQMAGDRNK